MNTLVPKLLRGMTNGFFVNIGNSEDTSGLITQFEWEGLYIPMIDRPLHDLLEKEQAPTLIHYLTINETIDAVTHLGQFLEDSQKQIGWKRWPIIVRMISQYNTHELMDKNHYTLVGFEGKCVYYIHKIWDVLI